ncbi:MAG: MBL fold metallo-hydrolase [Magnetospirillum sp.]|nr:MBL fold metallo-hydrolase [Magnetospirillum sp.]
MKVTILGCGGASGVPAISAGWGACDPANPRNRRRRPSILVEDCGSRILVDTSPDLRAQLLGAGVNRLDAVIYTHDHADHLHGIDDLREVNRAMKGPLPIWASETTLATIGERFGYVLEPLSPGATSIYKPLLVPNIIRAPFAAGTIRVVPFDQDHGYGRTVGLRFGPIAYSTDVVAMPDESFAALAGIDTWIVGCLVDYPHMTHAHVDKVLEWAERVKPRRTVLTHMGPRLDYDALKARLPAHVEPGYDGMVLEA